MKFINIEEIPKDEYLIEEGEDGDKFYIILKGSCIVHKAIETEIPGYSVSLHPEKKAELYMQCLWVNRDTIHWSKVPYAAQIRNYFRSVQRDNKVLARELMPHIWRVLAEGLSLLFKLGIVKKRMKRSNSVV